MAEEAGPALSFRNIGPAAARRTDAKGPQCTLASQGSVAEVREARGGQKETSDRSMGEPQKRHGGPPDDRSW